MPFLIISIVIQVLFVLHIVKTGRSTTWIWIVMMLPLAGSVAYLIAEVLPSLGQSRSVRSASRQITQAFNPDGNLHKAADDFKNLDTTENAWRLADELMLKQKFEEARELYRRCLTGVHQNDPDLMCRLAKAEFCLNSNQQVKAILDRAIEENPDYKNPDAHLIYARNLEQLGDVVAARQEYEELHGYFSGPEAAYWYALFLKNQGDIQLSSELFQGIVAKAEKSGKHYNFLYKEWINKSKEEILQ